jgi:hypothetical protein
MMGRTDTENDPMKLDESLAPDVMLPAQLVADVRALRDPERRLRLAVLEDAIRYFQRYLDATDARQRALYEDAVDWFGSPDRSEPFSFENVCDALELDPDYLRQGLCRWRAAARGRNARATETPGADRTMVGQYGQTAGRHLRAA